MHYYSSIYDGTATCPLATRIHHDRLGVVLNLSKLSSYVFVSTRITMNICIP